MTPSLATLLEEGNRALEQGAWEEARERFEAANALKGTGEAHEGLGWRDFVEFFNAFPDLKATIGETMTDSDRYAFQFTMTGTHKGPLVGPSGHIPATGKEIEVGGGAFGRIGRDGKIVEEHRYYDTATLMGQLGLPQ